MHASEKDAHWPPPQDGNNSGLNELIRLALGGNKQAQDELMERCRKRFAPFAYGLKHLTKDDPEDLIQEASLKVWRKLRNFDSEGNFWAWATTVARREMLTMLKIPPKVYKDVQAVREAHDQIAAETGGLPTVDLIAEKTGLTPRRVNNLLSKHALVFTASLDELEAGGNEPVDQSLPDRSEEEERTQDYCAMAAAMTELEERDRKILMLHYFENLPLNSDIGSSVAQILGINPTSIRKYHQRAKEKLREIMERKTA